MVVLLFIALDFSSPMTRGAFELNLDDSLDCARTETFVRIAPAAAAITTRTARLKQPLVLARVVRLPPAPLVNRRADVTRDRLIEPSGPQPSSEDH